MKLRGDQKRALVDMLTRALSAVGGDEHVLQAMLERQHGVSLASCAVHEDGEYFVPGTILRELLAANISFDELAKTSVSCTPEDAVTFARAYAQTSIEFCEENKEALETAHESGMARFDARLGEWMPTSEDDDAAEYMSRARHIQAVVESLDRDVRTIKGLLSGPASSLGKLLAVVQVQAYNAGVASAWVRQIRTENALRKLQTVDPPFLDGEIMSATLASGNVGFLTLLDIAQVRFGEEEKVSLANHFASADGDMKAFCERVVGDVTLGKQILKDMTMAGLPFHI